MNIREMELCEQRSPAWHRARWGKIGGTGLGKLMGTKASRDKLTDELVGCRLEEFYQDDSFQNSAMQRGCDLEPEALEYCQDLTGYDFQEFGWLQSDISILGISPDGLTEDRTKACELKCPSMSVFQSYIRLDEIPAEYHWQCINYFLVIPELEELVFMAYRPESLKPHFVYRLKRCTKIKFKKEYKTVQEYVQDAREVVEATEEEVIGRASQITASMDAF